MITVLIFEPDPMVSRILTEAVQAVGRLEAVKTVREIKQLTPVFEALHPQLILGETAEPGFLEWFMERRARGCPTDLLPVTRERDAIQYQKVYAAGIIDYLIKPFPMERLHTALERYVRWKNGLMPDQKLTQRQLDRLMYRQPAVSEESFFGNENTQQKILTFIAERGGESFTAADAAKALGISTSTARRYLDQLQKEGQLEVLQEYGHIGRPVNHYRIFERICGIT